MNVKSLVLGLCLIAGQAGYAVADSCQANIFGGQDVRNSDGSTSTSQSNIFGGQDVRYSDGRSSTSHSNIFDGQDTRNY